MVDKKLSEFTEASEEEVSYFPVLDSSTKNRKLPAKVLTGIKTNCITKIPQDIKLELSSGTLTLKAGSKVYVPNGSGTFAESTVENDVSTTGYHDGKIMILAQCSSTSTTTISAITESLVSSVSSGTSSPTNGVYYNTSSNMFYMYSSGAPTYRFSLPIAICTRTSGVITSIDQVFNGFGFVGSTLFVLPGVKGLAPNGRNEDGTLKSISVTVSGVKTNTFGSGTTGEVTNWIATNQNIGSQKSNMVSYLNEQNMMNSGTNIFSGIIYSSVMVNAGVITSFNPKTAFHAVDYSGLINENHIYNGMNWFAGNRTQGIATQTTEYAYTDTPATSSGIMNYEIVDKNGAWIAIIGAEMYDNGDNAAKMQAKGKTGATAALRIYVKNDGTDYLTCSSGVSKSIVSLVMPNYSAGVSKTTSANTEWEASGNGFVSVYKQVPNTSTSYYVYVNNQVVGYGISIECQSGMSTVFPVNKGDKIKYNVAVNSAIFYPCRGG